MRPVRRKPTRLIHFAIFLLAVCTSVCVGNRIAFCLRFVSGRSGIARVPRIATNAMSTPAARSSESALLFMSVGADAEEKNLHYSLQSQRADLKRQLLEAADEFKRMQEAMDRILNSESENDSGIGNKRVEKGYVFRLVRKIFRKILRNDQKKIEARKNREKKMRRILGSEAFGTIKLEVGELGNTTIALAEKLSELNPSAVPTLGWKGYAGDPSNCKLGGRWKLRFTTAADATFTESPKRGTVSTSQEVDPAAGTLTNVVDFERGKLKGFRVIVAGEAVSDNEIDLTFRKVEIYRESRFPRAFGKITFPIPARLLRAVNRYLSGGKSSSRGPYFQLKYLDDDLRMHKTGEGNWFIQSRLE